MNIQTLCDENKNTDRTNITKSTSVPFKFIICQPQERLRTNSILNQTEVT